MRTALDAALVDDLAGQIADVAAAHDRARPGARPGRQPVHTVYVPADQVDAGTVSDIGREAGRLLRAHAPDADALTKALGVAPSLADDVHHRLIAKLASEPVEDLRIDFEDGYGARDDAAEDADAERAALAVARMLDEGTAPPFVGLRVKSFADGGQRRAIRTLDGFVTTLLGAAGRLPDGLRITFPKVVAPAHVAHFASLLGALEDASGLAARTLTFEVQVETVESVIGDDGRAALPAILAAADGRMVGAHFGVFDYTAACGLPAGEQRIDHPACDFARHVMQVSLAGTGVALSDGSTNRVPRDDDTATVAAVWRRHAALVRRSLAHGFHQGWDMHPAHVVSRFATVFAFHQEHLADTTARLSAWASRDGSARGAGDGGPAAGTGAGDATGADVADEPATVRALQASLRRAIDCGAVEEAAALSAAGLTPADLP